jgi:hypothetical protein
MLRDGSRAKRDAGVVFAGPAGIRSAVATFLDYASNEPGVTLRASQTAATVVLTWVGAGVDRHRIYRLELRSALRPAAEAGDVAALTA